MSTPKDTFTYHRSRLAILTRQRAPKPELDEARRTLKAIRLRDQIRAALESTPQLTADERDELAALLRSENGGQR